MINDQERTVAQMKDWGDIGLPTSVKTKILYGCSCQKCKEEGPTPEHSKKPELRWDDHCPVEAGDEIMVSSTRGIGGTKVPIFSIKITGVTRTKKGTYIAHYIPLDGRGQYLAQGNQGDQHGYTRSGQYSIDPDAPAPEPEFIAKLTAEAHTRDAEREKSNEHPKKRERRVVEQFRRALSSLNADEQDALLADMNGLVLKYLDRDVNAN